jgi:hypothetical protein
MSAGKFFLPPIGKKILTATGTKTAIEDIFLLDTLREHLSFIGQN